MNPTVIIAAIAFCVGGAVVGEVQEWRLNSLQGKFDKFVGDVKHAGEIAQRDATIKETKDQALKEKTDATRDATIAALTTDNDRLRRNAAGRSVVPQVPTGSKRPDLACFDRAEFATAIDGFRAEARRIAEKGATVTVDLDSAKNWAKAQQPAQ